MRGVRPAALRKSFREFSPQAPNLWLKGNVTLGYLSTLNTWAKGLNLLLLLERSLHGIVPLGRFLPLVLFRGPES
jgi:hypothetical protein